MAMMQATKAERRRSIPLHHSPSLTTSGSVPIVAAPMIREAMTSRLEVLMRRWSILLVPALIAVSTPAFAQFGPGGGMRPGGQPGGGNPSQMGPEEKEEGPAENAPEQQAENPALQPLPAWPQQREKTLQFFELHGYIRFRSYLFHALNLGIWQGPMGPQAPFTIPYTEFGSNGQSANTMNPAASCAQRDKSNCRTDNLTSADMRLRLEPVVNVTEQVRVKVQLDVFDNLVMGSSPQGYYLNNAGAGGGAAGKSGDVPYSFASQSQNATDAGINAVYNSVR